MPSLHVKPHDRASQEDERYWSEEADFYSFREGNQRAPQDSADYRGWGIPKHKLPPPDAFEYVVAKYREHELGWREHDKGNPRYMPLHPMYKCSFLFVVMAHFLWFRTVAGARWVMRLYGIEEVSPFYDGYAYFWSDPTTKRDFLLAKPTYLQDPRNPRDAKLVDGVEIRIFREWEKVLDPPCSAQNKAPLEDMKKLLSAYRSPYAGRDVALPSDDVFFWVAEVLRDWFLQPEPNQSWPTRKPTRVCGWQWVKNLERSPGVKFFEAMEQVNLYRGRAYRLRDPSGGVIWKGGKEIRIVPLKDLYLMQGSMTEAQVDDGFRCQSCRKRKACVPATREQHRCCHCYAVELEQGDRPTLNRCTMDRECKACPDVIGNYGELVQLKNRLNRPARTGPVPR